MKKKQKKIFIICVIVVLSFLVVMLGAAFYFMPKSNVIARGVKINGIDIGNLSYSSAKDKVFPKFGGRATDLVIDGDIVYTITENDLNLEKCYEEALDAAKKVGKDGEIIKKLSDTFFAMYYGKNITIKAAPGVDENIQSILIDVSKKTTAIEPENAEIDVIDGKPIIKKEVTGKTLDIEESRKIILEQVLTYALNSSNPKDPKLPKEIVITAKISYPEITAKDLEKFEVVLGNFSTNLNGTANRVSNIRTSANSINGYLMKPGDTFSFNEVVGERTVARGYKTAPVISDGLSVPGIGGGICQTSTTLYNAVLYANLKVVSRKPHSLPSSYVPTGRDATVSWGSIDFKFENDRDSDIMLFMKVVDGKVIATILGSGDKQEVEIVRSGIGTIPFKVATKNGGSASGTEIQKKGKNGHTVTVSKIITYPDGKKETVQVSRDIYPAQTQVVIAGSKKQDGKQPAGADGTKPKPQTGGGSSVNTDSPPESASKNSPDNSSPHEEAPVTY